jgi:alkanesulfonate monooxygenase SsuD/methylene tetrahydromethanopterin reductase-like flavin-dependent oxidoreductase (luciferase family)
VGVSAGIAVTFQNPRQWEIAWPDLYEETLAFVELAEELGIDQVWLPEHHFTEDGFCPSLMVAGAAIAARTERIRIGSKIAILPFHDPIRLAEDVAVVDNVSAGRVEVGLAAGYRKGEFDGFGIPHSERGRRMEEGIELLTRGLAGERFSYSGRFHSYGEVQVTPPPVQRPVPLWLGGRTPAAMRRAARFGAGLVLADFDVAACQEDIANYLAAWREFGRDPAAARICAVASLFVATDTDRAWEVAGPHVLYQQNQWLEWFNEVQERPLTAGLMQSVDELQDAAALIGTGAEVAARIRAFHAEVPFTHFSFFNLLPGMRLAVASDSLRLFAAEVLPTLRSLDATTVATNH